MEPFSSIAAAVGLADVGLRTLVGIYGIAMDLKDVPDKLRAVHGDLQRLQGFVSDVQTHASGILAKATPPQLERSEKVLKAIALGAGELTRVLESTVPSPGSSRVERAWRAIVSVSKQKDILADCERLGRLKQDLQLELQAIGITMARLTGQTLDGVSASVTRAQAQVNALHPKVDAIHDSVTASAAQMQHAVQKMDPLAEAVSRVEESSERIEVLAHSLHQLLLSGGSGIGVHVATATRVERREAAVICCRKLAHYPADLQAAVDALSSMDAEPNRAAPTRQVEPPGFECSCRTKTQRSSRQLGPITTRYSAATFHEASCHMSLYRKSRSDYVICLNLRPFLNRAIQLFFSSSHRRGTWEISRVWRPHRIVPRSESPAFKLFDELTGLHHIPVAGGTVHKYLTELSSAYNTERADGATYQGQPTPNTRYTSTSTLYSSQSLASILGKDFISTWLASAPRRLHEMFLSGAAEPKDTDEFGNGLLHEVVFCWSLLFDCAEAFQDQIQQISSYLYHMGADASAVCPVRREATWDFDRRFAMQFHTRVDIAPSYSCPTVSDLAFYQLLRPIPGDQGAHSEVEGPFPFRIMDDTAINLENYFMVGQTKHVGDTAVGMRSRLLAHVVKLSADFELQVGIHLTPLHEAVLSRATAKVLALISKLPPADEPAWECALSVVECALRWPEGLVMLCNAGYRTHLAFETIIHRNDRTAAEMMMALDLRIDEHHLHSVSHIPGDNSYPAVTELHNIIIQWTASSLASQRAELRDMAVAKLPARILQSLGLDMTKLPDSISGRLVEQLEAVGIVIPRHLYPASQPVFHCFVAHAEASETLAEALFKSGFREIDALNDKGRTPIGRAFEAILGLGSYSFPMKTACRGVHWMLQHGASISRDTKVGEAGIRPLFGLACSYSARYGGMRRLKEWQWNKDESFGRIVRGLRVFDSKEDRNALENEFIQNMLWELGLVSRSANPCSSVRSSSSRICLAASRPRSLGRLGNDNRSSDNSDDYDGSEYDSEYSSSTYESDEEFRSTFTTRVYRDITTPFSLIKEVAFRDQNIEDACECYCSTNGCLPIHMISVLETKSSVKSWFKIQDDIFDWIEDCGARYNGDQYRHYLTAACRLEVFSRLGMAHTCCRTNSRLESQKMSEETKRELREEDSELKEQLDLIMSAFQAVVKGQEPRQFRPTWRRWWRKLDTLLLPLLPSERGLQYCKLGTPMAHSWISAALRVREVRQAVTLQQMGYGRDVDFLHVIKDNIPDLSNVGFRDSGSSTVWVQPHIMDDGEETSEARDNLFTERLVRRRRSF
ncbi:hypothetical protein QBC34DRAFT_417980 [Podospora aff. communis PSN243]|uniref:Fungal N-terminal domain-containing protein n=1 Tax=Podospora aff. communis PSN243 TaxID=3040156 RepID=A0AAV9G679_9PEZI|nr:hypothetical protein QBC34DRAFT_417980 [Podospora aff. communis PSN243]